MELEQILAIITPFIAGSSGIVGALLVFVRRIYQLRKEVKAQLTDNDTIRQELHRTRQALTDLTVKINYIVEEAKNGRKDKKG